MIGLRLCIQFYIPWHVSIHITYFCNEKSYYNVIWQLKTISSILCFNKSDACTTSAQDWQMRSTRVWQEGQWLFFFRIYWASIGFLLVPSTLLFWQYRDYLLKCSDTTLWKSDLIGWFVISFGCEHMF